MSGQTSSVTTSKVYCGACVGQSASWTNGDSQSHSGGVYVHVLTFGLDSVTPPSRSSWNRLIRSSIRESYTR